MEHCGSEQAQVGEESVHLARGTQEQQLRMEKAAIGLEALVKLFLLLILSTRPQNNKSEAFPPLLGVEAERVLNLGCSLPLQAKKGSRKANSVNKCSEGEEKVFTDNSTDYPGAGAGNTFKYKLEQPNSSLAWSGWL